MIGHNRAPALWLIACAVLVFAMVVVGGLTRLTRSGLSIVEWDPILGAIPPLTDAQWQEAFGKYQLTPEYREVNYGMSLAEFKEIYYIEWFHRLLGRLIGLVFLGGLAYFWLRGQLSRVLVLRLVGIFLLGALQGALGWYMVMSGLVDLPRVSPYRLTAHLGLAVAIYALILWTAFSLLFPRSEGGSVSKGLQRFAWGVVGLVFLMILTGGFVAGTKAGFVFNTFPLMNGRFVPKGVFALTPWWANLFENVATVQFNHRLLAYVLVIVTAAFYWTAQRAELPPRARLAAQALLGLLALQIMLGISTLLYVVPLGLAAAHQAGALLVFSAALYLVYALQRNPRRPRDSHPPRSRPRENL